jgi:hypothetical protein
MIKEKKKSLSDNEDRAFWYGVVIGIIWQTAISILLLNWVLFR